MKFTAITLDLDDTLWPIAPVMERADRALQAWIETRCPEVAQALPVEQMRSLRDEVFATHAHLGHDFTEMRMICLRRAFTPHGYGEREVEQAFEVFYAARNDVQFYPEVGDALERLARHAPLVALTNGNACLKRVGLDHRFHASITARSHGSAKPAVSIFHAACALVGSAPSDTLHVGDHPEQDMRGALSAGMHAAWVNRDGEAWQFDGPAPRIFSCLAQVADFVEGR